MASIRWHLLLISVLCLLSGVRTQVNVNEIKLPDTNGKSAISSSSTSKTTQTVTKSVSVSAGKTAQAAVKVQVQARARVPLVCPANDTAVPLFTLPCERDSDCSLLGAGLMCCARKDVRFKRCLKGLPAPKPEPPHAPWLRVFPRKCPESPIAEFREVKNCTTDVDCTPRICCPERGTSESYCRTAAIQFDEYPTVKRMLEHNNKINEHKVPRIPKTIHFSAEEEKILILWKELDVLNSCLKQSKGKPKFSFYDGPPFATGLPHFGHILTGTIKDIVTRYAHQQGFHVERRFGWDCHGLPVEYEIDKIFNIKCPADVMKMGIKKYNNECRKIVSRYVNDWEEIIWRVGRWIDFKNDYKTMYPWYMESIWWVFKELFNKGLVYKGVKVMPFSTACNTPLSNFECNQNYKDVVDPAIIVSFVISEDLEKASLLIWTTTPWSLPSNLALCVNSKLTYVKLREIKSGNIYILLQDRLNYVFNEVSDYVILDHFLGLKLENLKYEPLFPYFTRHSEKEAFKVVCDDFVSADCGTGVVHLAPYFGEHDYRVCLATGIINTDQEPICPVDVNGRFTDQVTDFKGEYIKDADKKIINFLKNEGKIVKISHIKHSYPFCWRSDTPLIYKAVPSWFIRVKHMIDKLQKNTNETYWVPDFVREKRFGNWLREARDWAVSRNRYWGTPIPLWISPDGEEVVCVGSIKELEILTNTKVLDLHREYIDHLEIPSKIPGKPNLRRITEVFDCWFESGAMPFAQQHYPFENLEHFNDCFPADFIAEGIDQTRGWFYTLIVLSTILFNKSPFKNVIVNGLVLASDGQKMSKSKNNFSDPKEIINMYGADALRLYLISSPVVRAENLKFENDGVKHIVKQVLLPWFHAFRFLFENIEFYVQETNKPFEFIEEYFESRRTNNIMDRWILSSTQTLLNFVHSEMKLYHLYTVAPRLIKFIDQLTNWYIRMNRTRLKGNEGSDEARTALTTLFGVLFDVVKLMAPLTPFLSEYMYQHMKKLMNHKSVNSKSVHFILFSQINPILIDETVERSVSRMQSVIQLGRVVRDKKNISLKYPLPEIIIIHHDQQYIKDIHSLENYILSELNIKKLTLSNDMKKFNVRFKASPNYKFLGTKLKNNLKEVTAEIKNLTEDDIKEIMTQGWKEIAGQRIESYEICLKYEYSGNDISTNGNRYEMQHDNNVLILLDVIPNTLLLDDGIVREIINRIQKLRNKVGLTPTDSIIVYYLAKGEIEKIVDSHKNIIQTNIKATFLPLGDSQPSNVLTDEILKIKDSYIYLFFTKT